jgi:hypothetical protein
LILHSFFGETNAAFVEIYRFVVADDVGKKLHLNEELHKCYLLSDVIGAIK